MNILVVKLSAVGDVVMSLPFLDSLRRAYPAARITWLVEEASADIVRGHPALDRVVVSRRKSWSKDLKAGRCRRALADLSGFLRELRSERYDLAVDLQGLFKSGILTLLSGGRRRIGFDRTRELSWVFLNEKLPPYDPDRHALLRYLDMALYLGADGVAPEGAYFPVDEAASKQAGGLLAGCEEGFIAMNPGAKWKTKLWPRANWVELAGLLARASGRKLVLTGGPDEVEANRAVASAAPEILDLTGRTTLKVLAEVYRSAGLLVCPDTGPMHLAAAVGLPVAALFGPTAPWRTGPFGSGHMVLRTEEECSPCFRKSCPDPRCMTGLTPMNVFRAVTARLEKRDFEIQDTAH